MDVSYNFPPSFKAPLDGRTQNAYDKKDLNQKRKKVREAFSHTQAMTQAPSTSKAPRKRILSTTKPLDAAKITAATRKRKADSDMPTAKKGKAEADFVSNEPENRGVFLYTNELGSQQVLEQLRKLPARGNVGMGVSGLYNLELFLARAEQGVNYWMIIDPAPEVQAFWRVVIEAFTVSQNLDEVFGFVHNTMVLKREAFFTTKFMQNNGWSNEDFPDIIRNQLQECKKRIESCGNFDFDLLKSLVLQGLMLFPIDLVNSEQVQSALSVMKSNNLVPDTLYTSNVELWIPDDMIPKMRENVTSIRSQSQLGSAQPAYVLDALPKTSSGYVPADNPLAKMTSSIHQRLR